jgi:hypothetical protein
VRLTVKDAYKVFFIDHRLEMDKKASKIHAVMENRIHQTWNNRMLPPFVLNKGNNTGDYSKTSTTGATTAHEDKITDPTSTATTARTPTSPNPMHQETVNFVYIAKS